MLRERITHSHKAADSFFKAARDMTTGMAVVKNIPYGTFDFPTAATGANLFWVQKERIPSGINAARTDMSDYDEDYTTVKKDEPAVLYQFSAGERFSTDAYAEALSDSDIGKPLEAGTDGKVKAATGASIYVFAGWHDDAGHKLADITVMDTPVKA